MSNIYKVWGERRRLLLTDKCEIDLLYLKKNTFCSTHSHKRKINRFVIIEGAVKITTEFGQRILYKTETWTVIPPSKHRFFALEDSVMIELAFVEEGIINLEDIERLSQGGKIVNGKELTEDELRKKGLLEL